MRRVIVTVVAALFIIQATISAIGQELEQTPADCALEFDGNLANQSVHFQTDLGPRLPGSSASSELRNSIKSNLSGWHITESTHHSEGWTLTNLYATWNKGMGSEVIFAAHYDTRHKAERDWNESRRGDPIDGANDGASGVAVLLELARIIPQMNLSHEVTLFFTDAEDQGDDWSTYVLGAKAWADNLTTEEANSIESFILVDMVGDSDLTLRQTDPGNVTLWNRTKEIVTYIADVCELNDSSYFDFENTDSIYDDHVPADNLGIPAIDIIDTRYGEGADFLGGHWHTHNDTADKVSAESLQTVGYILESGLISGAWINVRAKDDASQNTETPILDTDSDGILDVDDNCPEISGEDEFGCPLKDTIKSTNEAGAEDTIGILLMVCILFVWGNYAWIVFADNKGEG